MHYKTRFILISIIILIGLGVTTWEVLGILEAARDGHLEPPKISIPKTDDKAVQAIRAKEATQQSIDFSDDPVGGRPDPFTGGGSPTIEESTPIVEESDTTEETDAAAEL